MSIHLLTRVVAVAIGAVAIGRVVVADLKGDYKIEFVVEGGTYSGTAKFTPGQQGALSAKYDFTSPSVIKSDVTGAMKGDSVTFEGKYDDSGRGCSGTFLGKGAAEKDGSKASGTLDINDSCGGTVAGTFRIWR
jgi:hypothetical protein